MTTRFLLAALAYIVPTFPLGYLWHLVFFKSYYASLRSIARIWPSPWA